MSTPRNEQESALGKDVLEALDTLNGYHAGHRPAHAKGLMLRGHFQPSLEAGELTTAPHAHTDSTPVTVRFSDFAGVPTVPDNDPMGGGPRGCAVRFHLGEHVHTDLVAHSVDGFPVRTAEEFVEFLRAIPRSGPDAPKPNPLDIFLSTRPKAVQFVTTPKPFPASFATEAFFAVTAVKFINAAGEVRFGRFRIKPEAGTSYLTDEVAATKGPNYLFEEMAARLAQGPVRMKVVVQMAEPGDIVDDSTEHWPADRPEIRFGSLELNETVSEERIIFDPVARVSGIESSGDPLSEPRAAAYLISGRRRRAAM
ncbi:catalase family peroxidase [Bryobacter aggregatus]|uniref:catalase family peroxidase n=1 Tax=Bryobacter aggregatus TaxID=360054 RepID=UPI0004E0EDE7|nr:catalase family peroxidase [Bryobacter aggregatus]